MAKPPSDPHEMIDELFRDTGSRAFSNLAEVQRHVDARVNAYNASPQEELGGLSPAQLYELLHGDWTTTGALTVNEALSPDDVGDPPMVHNARALLATLRDEGPAKTTATGNLSREFVGRMLSRLGWEPGYLEDVRRMNKVINESDVRPLETIRHVLQIAKLIHRRKGFHITPLGRALLDDARRGELLTLLFGTFFREIDLRWVENWDGDAGLQQTIAFTFWKLRTEAKVWTTPAHLEHVAWLEHTKDPVPPVLPDAGEFRAGRLRRRVLEPLVSLGLLESRDLPSRDKWHHPIEVRKTPLYDRMLRFEFSGSIPSRGR